MTDLTSPHYFPMHPAQREIYLAEMINTDSSQFNIGGRIVLKGKIDVEKLHQVVEELPGFFDACKMRFDFKVAEPVYKYEDDFLQAKLIDVDFSLQTNAQVEAKAWVRKTFNEPFKLTFNTIPFQYYLVKISEDEHWFVMKYHHLIHDGFGFIISIEHIADRYAALVKGEEFAPIYPSYHAEIVKANEYHDSDSYTTVRQYWEDKILHKPEKLLPKIYPLRDASGEISDTFNIDFSENDRALFSGIIQSCNAGFQQLTLAALIIYFGDILPADEFVFGTPVHKRGSKQLRNTVGMFSGALPVVAGYKSDQTIGDLLAEIVATQKKDYRYYNFQIGDLNRYLHINSSEDQLFDVFVNYEPLNLRMAFGDDIQARLIRLESHDDRNPLQICWRDYSPKQPLQLQIHFAHAYFRFDEIELLSERILNMIKSFPALLDKPLESISILSDDELFRIADFNATDVHFEQAENILDLFQYQVERYPQAIALMFEKEQVSYKELDERSDRTAAILSSRGVVKGDLIAVCMERGIASIVAIMGIIKAGGAYVPVDPSYPEERIRYILKDTACSIVLTGEEERAHL